MALLKRRCPTHLDQENIKSNIGQPLLEVCLSDFQRIHVIDPIKISIILISQPCKIVIYISQAIYLCENIGKKRFLILLFI